MAKSKVVTFKRNGKTYVKSEVIVGYNNLNQPIYDKPMLVTGRLKGLPVVGRGNVIEAGDGMYFAMA